MPGKKAIFAGCARDCARAIPHVLANVSRLSGLFAESAFVFVENDSGDGTKHLIQRWCQGRPNAHLISRDGLSSRCPVRTLRLAAARNHCLSLVRSDFQTYDYLFLFDCDEVNAAEIDLTAVKRAVDFLQQDSSRAAVSANTVGVYYDLWALRHPVRCPGDVWEEIFDYVLAHGVTDEVAYRETFSKRIFSLPIDAPPLEVDSAFGGLGIYKIQSLLENKKDYVGHKTKLIPWDPGSTGDGLREIGWQCSEHVSFNLGFREIGQRLFVLPYLVNFRTTSENFLASFWRSCVFDPTYAQMDLRFTGPDEAEKIGRNQPCPCGSGKRYKHCHGKFA